MTAAVRKTPTSTNGGAGDGPNYTAAVDAEIEALWKCVPTALTSVAGTNAITAVSDSALVGPIVAYARPMAFWLTPANTNTSSVTINIDTVGVLNLTDKDTNALAPGALVAGRLHLIYFDGTQCRVFSSPTPAVNPTPAPDIILQEQKAQNTTAGGFTASAWQLRALNTVVRNVVAGASLASSILTLPAGTYCAEWSAPAFEVNAHMSRLFNITDSAPVGFGTSAFSAASDSCTTTSGGKAVFTISVSKTFRVEHFCAATNGTNGLGPATNIATETYSWLHIYKIA